MKKRVLSLVFALVMLLCIVPMMVFPVSAATAKVCKVEATGSGYTYDSARGGYAPVFSSIYAKNESYMYIMRDGIFGNPTLFYTDRYCENVLTTEPQVGTTYYGILQVMLYSANVSWDMDLADVTITIPGFEVEAVSFMEREAGSYLDIKYAAKYVFEPEIFVGGVVLEDGDYLANNASVPTDAKPSGGYAYYKDGVLTLNNYSYTGNGFALSGSNSAMIYGPKDLTLVLEGENSLTGTSADNIYGISVDGDLSIRKGSDTGKLTVYSSDICIRSQQNMTIESGAFDLNSTDYDAIHARQGNLLIKDGTFDLDAARYGLHVYNSSRSIILEGGNYRIDSNHSGIGGNASITIKGGIYNISANYGGILLSNGKSSGNSLSILDGELVIRSNTTDYDSQFCALNADYINLALHLDIKAATTPDGTLGAYDKAQNATYDYVRITPTGNLWVGGVRMGNDTYLASGATMLSDTAPSSGGYAHYLDGVLTLHDYAYTGAGYAGSASGTAIIYTPDSLTIKLEGENTLDGTSAEKASGVRVDGSLILEAADNGKLIANTSYICIRVTDDLTIRSGSYDLTAQKNDAFYVSDGNILIEGGTFDLDAERSGFLAYSGSLTVENGTFLIETDNSFGISSCGFTIKQGDITMDSGSLGLGGYGSNKDIVIEGGTLVIDAAGIGLYCDEGKVDISGGEITVTTGAGEGIWSNKGSVNIYGGAVNVASNGDDGIRAYYINISGGDVTVTATGADGMETNYGDVCIDGGTVNVTGDDTGILSGDDVIIRGGTIYATAGGFGIKGYDVDIRGGDVVAKSTMVESDSSYCAIYAVSDLSIDNRLNVLASAEPDGSLGAYDPDQNGTYDYVTIAPVDIFVGGIGMNNGSYLASGASATTMDKPASGGYAYYKDGVLTLHDFQLETDADILIHAGKDLSLVLEGTSNLAMSEDAYDIGGIYVPNGRLQISGTGTLSLDVDETGIYSDGDLTITDATVIIKHAYDGIECSGMVVLNRATYRVDAAEDDGISCSTNITVTDSTVSLTSDYGFYVSDEGDVTITNSSVTVNAVEDAFLDINNLTVTDSSMDITSQDSTAVSVSDAVTITDSSVSINGYVDAVCADTVIIAGSKATLIGYYTGIDCLKFTISGSNVTAIGLGYGIYAEDSLIIEGSEIVAKSTVTEYDDNFSAIYSGTTSVTIDPNLTVQASTEPDGTLGAYDPEKCGTYDYIKITAPCVDGNLDHICDLCDKVVSECVDADKDHLCDICKAVISYCADLDKDHKCDTCGADVSECIDSNGDYKCDICGKDLGTPAPIGVTRLAGANRWATSLMVADEMKANLGVEKFGAIIVASGNDFADALAGSYLSTVKNAPILLGWGKGGKYVTLDEANIAYIKANLAPGGTVYILGGKNAVPELYETSLSGITVKRLGGANRFETNLLILEEAGVPAGSEVLVCTSTNFADSLSASATGKPILLVFNEYGKLYGKQPEYLAKLQNCTFTVIGGESAVSAKLADAIKTYGNVTRLAGANRFETSVLVAQKYFAAPATAVLAYAWNYPDGLCGGSLAYSMNAPLILTMTKYEEKAVEYAKMEGITSGVVLGGDGLISDAAVRAIFAMDASDEIVLKK